MINRLTSPVRLRRGFRTTALTTFALVLTTFAAPTALPQPQQDAPPEPSQAPIHVKNPNSNLCLNLYGSITDPGTPTEVWNCEGLISERWEYREDKTLYNVDSGTCLNLYGSLTDPGTPTEIWDCKPEQFPGEVWEWNPDGTLYNPYSDQCLSVVDGSTEPGARTEIRPCDVANSPDQKWVGEEVPT